MQSLTHATRTQPTQPQYAKRVLRIMQGESNSGHALNMPDHNILSYEVIAYCALGQDCALSTADLKVRLRMCL